MDDRVREIFDNASSLYEKAIEELERGKVRDAAEKAWGATLRATNALIVAKIGEEPSRTSETTDRLHRLSAIDGEVEILIGRYHTRADYLHGHCFYLGLCEPYEDIERGIRETNRYIEDAKRLAGVEREVISDKAAAFGESTSRNSRLRGGLQCQ